MAGVGMTHVDATAVAAMFVSVTAVTSQARSGRR
jgi:hypothetical protein